MPINALNMAGWGPALSFTAAAAGPRRLLKPVAVEGLAESGWLPVAGLLADVAFETDVAGRFTAFADNAVLGYAAQSLLGVPANALFNLAAELFGPAFASVCPGGAVWRGDMAIKQADGIVGLYRLALAPKPAGAGHVAGVHGVLERLEAQHSGLAGEPGDEALDSTPASGFASNAARMLCPETALWLRGSFIEHAARRFDRLDVEDRPGTMLLIGFGNMASSLYPEAAMSLAVELQEIIRPTDLIGRIDEAVIALWCDGMDHLTGAERAARFCRYLPTILPGHALVAVGLVTRWPGRGEDPQSLLALADAALKTAQAATLRDMSGHWQVAHGPV